MGPAMDIHRLLCHYNNLYFDGELCSCVVSWSNDHTFRYPGICYFEEFGYCEIELSQHRLLHHPAIDIKNILLHEMIHAYLWIRHQNSNHGDHGKNFQEIAKRIESCYIDDAERPNCGYKIALDHDFLKRDAGKSAQCVDVEIGVNREPPNADCPKLLSKDDLMSLFGKPTTSPSENCNVMESNKMSCEDPSSSRSSRKFGKQLARSKENDVAKWDTISYRGFYLVDDELKTSPGTNSPSRMNKKRDFLDTGGHMMNEAHDLYWQMKKQRCIEGSSSKQEMGYDVVVPLLNWYFSNEEGADEDEDKPLVNKRTERRKKHSSMMNKQKGILCIADGGNVVGSSSMNCIEVKSGSSEDEKTNEDGIVEISDG